MLNNCFLALDYPTYDCHVTETQTKLVNYFNNFKIGLELFCSGTVNGRNFTSPVFLDLKFNDIPDTVEKAVKSACLNFSPKFLTIHLSQAEAIKKAIAMANNYGTQILGVTCLTSMDEYDLKNINVYKNMINHVLDLVKLGYDNGCRGFVCSGFEVERIKSLYHDVICVVPGTRLKISSEIGSQKRWMSPKQAIQNGADYLVIGREVTQAPHPVAIAQNLAESLDF